MFAPAMDCYQVTADAGRASSRPWPPRLVPNEPVRGVGNQEQRHRWPHRRSLFGSAGGEPSPELAPGAQGQDIVPYQTYYVTQACEWKSNLFVPKSNDILFAQPQRVLVQPLADQRQQFPEVESSSGPFEDASSRTIFSTTNKALILALPPISHATFAGYEPACSIRLIVPRNMRILAKLTARRLTFEQELQPNTAQLEPTAVAPLGFGALGAEPTAPAGQLWLNVSQNQFSETEQKTIETEGNVLAFRFLLERFASLREPDIRLQVVLTAFQTWGENSDTGLAVGQPPTQSGDQLICDSGRLISANLACDGFRNCLDGQDEEPASCAALRQQQQQQQQQQGTTPHLNSFNQTKPSTRQTTGGGAGGPSNRWAPARVLNWIARDASPLVALLAGLLLLLLLLFCCTCCCYCLMLLVRKATANVQDNSDTSRRRVRRRLAALKLLDADASGGGGQAGRDGEDLETDSLARGQNLENAARLKAARGLLEGGGTSTNQQQQQPLVAGQVRQIQSILKRPMVSGGGQQLPTSVSYKGVAPLARFESIPTLGSDPPPPPPRASAANRKSTTDAQQQHPSPRRGALADSLTSARSSGRSFPDFRPTPATRAGGKREPSSAATSALRSQPSSSGTSRPGAPQVGVAQPVRPTTSSAGREGQQQQPRAPAAGETSGFALESRTTKLEQTSTSTGNGERLTVYQYSSNLAQYSESYLLREQQQQRHASGSSPGATLLVTGARVAPSSSTVANDNPKDEDDEAPELPPKSRQSSLI